MGKYQNLAKTVPLYSYLPFGFNTLRERLKGSQSGVKLRYLWGKIIGYHTANAKSPQLGYN